MNRLIGILRRAGALGLCLLGGPGVAILAQPPAPTYSILEPNTNATSEGNLPAPAKFKVAPKAADAPAVATDLVPEPRTPAASSNLPAISQVASQENALNELFSDPIELPRQSLPRQTLKTQYGYELLLQGPVHEAFAMPVDPEAQKSIEVIAASPPATINEQQPSSEMLAGNPKIEGKNVQWIGGYWAWEDTARNYVWVSGFFRDIPPGRTWQAGSWSETTGGHRWTSGYWADASGVTVSSSVAAGQLPPPPPSGDQGPSKPAAKSASFWLAGQWIYKEGDYQWQAGYWTNQPDRWIWQPATYVHTPDGYVYVSGYWDYEPEFRGQPFAPVIFNALGDNQNAAQIVFQPIYPQARAVAMLMHLFVRPGYRHYFYGDYYDNAFQAAGYLPWYQEKSRSQPMLSYYTDKYARYEIDFVTSMARYDAHFRSGRAIRPAVQFAANPRIALIDGVAGIVNADSFDTVVRGVVAGRTANLQQQVVRSNSEFGTGNVAQASAVAPSNNSPDTSIAGREPRTRQLPNRNSASQTTNPAALAANSAAQAPNPTGAAARLPLARGGMIVLPGGRIVVAPAGSAANALGLQPGLNVPAIPPLGIGLFGRGGLGSRIGRRN